MAGLRAEFGTVHATVGTAGWSERYMAAQARAELLWAVVSPAHWKGPIDAYIPADLVINGRAYDLTDLAYAIEHFTATVPTFTPVDGGYHVTADGYAAGPAGDH